MRIQISLSDLKHVYFLGIGGIGMSAIARWFLHNGFSVSGYDKTESPLTRQLAAEGMHIHYEDSIDLIPKIALEDPEHCLFIFTPAIPSTHLGKQFLESKGIALWKRSQILGWITEQIPTLAVAGTHGKTTTSSLLAHLLKYAGKNVTAFLGGITQNYGTNFIPNVGPENVICVVEADEYDRSFLTLHPQAAVVTSTDADHLDIYGGAEQVLESFQLFTDQIQPDGFFIQKDGLSLYSKEKTPRLVSKKAIFKLSIFEFRITEWYLICNIQVGESMKYRCEFRVFITSKMRWLRVLWECLQD